MSLAVINPSTRPSLDSTGIHLIPSLAIIVRHIPTVSSGRQKMTCVFTS
jgi:hypothetical protein